MPIPTGLNNSLIYTAEINFIKSHAGANLHLIGLTPILIISRLSVFWINNFNIENMESEHAPF